MWLILKHVIVSMVPSKQPNVLMKESLNCLNLSQLFFHLGLPICSQKFMGIRVTSLPVFTYTGKIILFNLIFSLALFSLCLYIATTAIFSWREFKFSNLSIFLLYLHTDWKMIFLFTIQTYFYHSICTIQGNSICCMFQLYSWMYWIFQLILIVVETL